MIATYHSLYMSFGIEQCILIEFSSIRIFLGSYICTDNMKDLNVLSFYVNMDMKVNYKKQILYINRKMKKHNRHL